MRRMERRNSFDESLENRALWAAVSEGDSMDANEEAKAALKKFLDSNPEEYAEAYQFGKWWAVLKPVHAGLLDTLKEDVDLIEASLVASNLPPNWKSPKWDILQITLAKVVANLSGLGVPKEIRP